MIKRLKRNKGMTYPLAVFVILGLLLFAFAIFEVVRLNIIAAAVRDKYQAAIISSATENYKNVYPTVRESYAASVTFNGYSWRELDNVTQTKIYNRILSNLNTGERSQCSIAKSSIDFTVSPSTIAPSNVYSSQTFDVDGKLVVTIPLSFAWDSLPPIRMNVNVKSQWKMQF